MKTRVIQDDSDDPTTFEDRAEAPVEQKRSTNLAAHGSSGEPPVAVKAPPALEPLASTSTAAEQHSLGRSDRV